MERISRTSGVTIVELVIVLVILGILSAVAAPRFFSRSGFHERFFFQDSLAALRYAQKLAVASGCEVQVTFSASDYALAQRASCQSGAFSQAVPNPGTGGASYTNQAPSGVSTGTMFTKASPAPVPAASHPKSRVRSPGSERIRTPTDATMSPKNSP